MGYFKKFTLGLFLSLYLCEMGAGDTFGTPRLIGNGCSSENVAFLPTETAFTMIFNHFSLSTDRGESFFRYCIMNLSVSIPRGFSISVESVDHRGFTALEVGARGVVWSDYRLGTSEFGSSPITVLKGPFEDEFIRRDTAKSKSIRSVCGARSVNLRVSSFAWVIGNSRARGALTLDSTDGAIQLKLNRERCN